MIRFGLTGLTVLTDELLTIMLFAVRSSPTGRSHHSTEGGETEKSESVIKMKREMKENMVMEEFNYQNI